MPKLQVADHSVTIPAPIEKVWEKITEVNSWPAWDESIETIQFVEQFAEGSKGIFKPIGAPSATGFNLLNVVPPERFDVSSKLPLGNEVVFFHFLQKEGRNTKLTHVIEIRGWASRLFNFLIGKGMKKALAPSMEKFKHFVG